MSDPALDDAVREAVREALAQLLPGMVAGAVADARGAHGAAPVPAEPAPERPAPRPAAPSATPVPLVPAPPVAATHRPSGAAAPAAPALAARAARSSTTAPARSVPVLAPQAAPAAVPMVPAPPIAAVHRPGGSTPMGSEPAAPRSHAAPAAPAPAVAPARRTVAGGDIEDVQIASDADLDAFARHLLKLYENPRDRMRVKSGKLRFRLRGAAVAGRPAAVVHVEKGAVTERHVKEAAAAGATLLLGRRAVLTPMARDRARALGVVVEKEA